MEKSNHINFNILMVELMVNLHNHKYGVSGLIIQKIQGIVLQKISHIILIQKQIIFGQMSFMVEIFKE
ncbi:hypothetical protein SDC9_71749 [bioreactor metagenome]|uniref:Uncharacterized protein n=1 Tax=bioreactor metagenome TaxID=1076179 RepID=A0A644YAB9_9ZZZZ